MMRWPVLFSTMTFSGFPSHLAVTFTRQRPRAKPAGGEGASSAVDGWRGAVLLVAYVLAPRDGATLFVDLHHRYVAHEAVGGGPCQCSSSGSKNTRSPGRITSISPPRRWHKPKPLVT